MVTCRLRAICVILWVFKMFKTTNWQNIFGLHTKYGLELRGGRGFYYYWLLM